MEYKLRNIEYHLIQNSIVKNQPNKNENYNDDDYALGQRMFMETEPNCQTTRSNSDSDPSIKSMLSSWGLPAEWPEVWIFRSKIVSPTTILQTLILPAIS